jgi:hypothetical protein
MTSQEQAHPLEIVVASDLLRGKKWQKKKVGFLGR